MRRLRATAALMALGAVGSALIAAPAAGRIANSKVSIGIGFVSGTGAPFFQGQVKSGRASCRVNRPVGIFFQRNRGKLSFFKRDRSDSSGYYRVDMNQTMRTGGYIARVKPKPGCKKDLSNPIAVGQNGPGGVG